jgi:hypothetical protein
MSSSPSEPNHYTFLQRVTRKSSLWVRLLWRPFSQLLLHFKILFTNPKPHRLLLAYDTKAAHRLRHTGPHIDTRFQVSHRLVSPGILDYIDYIHLPAFFCAGVATLRSLDLALYFDVACRHVYALFSVHGVKS